MTRLLPALLAAAVLLPACGVGYNRVLFSTRSTVGIDIDSQPPTMELALARREGVIEPTFADGETLPVVASFGSNSSSVERLLFGVNSTFATGPAAVALSKYFTDETPADLSGSHGQDLVTQLEDESAIHVAELPGDSSWMGDDSPHRPKDPSPLVFGTDSTLGFKLGASGSAGLGTEPTLMLGYRRKELALAPVRAEVNCPVADCRACRDGRREKPCTAPGCEACSEMWTVSMPAVLATLIVDLESNLPGSPAAVGGGVEDNYQQYFATGRAATFLAMRQDVRRAMIRRVVPGDVFAGTSGLEHRIEESALILEARLGMVQEALADPDRPGALDMLQTVARLVVDLELLAAEDEITAQDGAAVAVGDLPQESDAAHLVGLLRSTARALIDFGNHIESTPDRISMLSLCCSDWLEATAPRD